MAEVFIARESAVVDYDGSPTRIRKGVTRIEEGHPLLTAHADLFEPAADNAQFPVRTATAEPKAPRRAAKKAAATAEKPTD